MVTIIEDKLLKPTATYTPPAVAKITPPSGASTNVKTNTASAFTGTTPNSTYTSSGGFTYKTDAKGTPYGNPIKTQSTTTLSSDKQADITTNNNALTVLDKKGVSTDTKTGIAKYADGTVYDEPTEADTSEEDKQIENAFKEMRRNTDAIAAGSIASIQSQYARLKEEQRKVNESQLAGTKSALLMSGAMQGDVYSDDAIAYRMNQGINEIKDLENEENELINAAKAAQLAGNNKILESKVAQINLKREEKLAATAKLNEEIVKSTQAKQKLNDQIQTEEAISTLYEQGITDPSQISKQLRAAGYPATQKEVSDTVALMSGVGGTGMVGEYNFYKADATKRGLVPLSFDEYQNRDANRKISIAKAGVAGTIGGSGTLYTPQQEKVIVRVDKDIANSPTYKRTVSMRAFADNVESALSQGTGVGDIAAINQFQKVIDEGAVTRDQDVKLIQGAQSLANSLSTQISKLSKGEQLSPTLRQQMKKTVQDILKAQEKAIGKDAFIAAKKNELTRNKIDPTDSILGELEQPESSTDNLIKTGEEAKSKIDTIFDTLPENVQDMIVSSYESDMSDIDIYNQLKARGLVE